MIGSAFILPLFAILVSALPQPSCITFFFDNGNAQSPPTSTVFRSTSTLTSTLPCGSCMLQTQAFFPYPFYGYAAIEDGFTTTVTSPLGTSTSFVCAPLTLSTKKATSPLGTRLVDPTRRPGSGTVDPPKAGNTTRIRGPTPTGAVHGSITPSGFLSSSRVQSSRGNSLNQTAFHGSISATRVSILTLPNTASKNLTTLRPIQSSGIAKQTPTCTSIDPAAPSASCLTLTFISGNFTSCTSCPSNPADLGLCPFLCSIPFRGGPILQCSPTNLEGNSNIPHFAAASCQKCLPACDVTSITARPYYPSVSRLPSSSLVSRLSSPSAVSRLPSSSRVSHRSSLSLVSRLSSQSPVSRLPSSSLISRRSFSSPVSRLPSSSLVSRLPSQSPVSRLASSSLISRLPSQSLVSQSPSYSRSSRTLLNPDILSLSASKATLTASISAPSTTSSIGVYPSSSCPLVPAVIDYGDPCQVDFNDNLICNACPTLFQVNIFTCPFLCQVPFSDGLSALQCSQSDLTGESLLSSFNGTVQSCQQCLTDCPPSTFIFSRAAVTSMTVSSSTSTSAPSTCTSIGASVTSSLFLITSDEVLYRESCGTTRAETDACPFLCSGSRAQLFNRCTQTDESGTFFDDLVQLCEPCLPPCEGYRKG